MSITRIRVPSHWWDTNAAGGSYYREDVATFELGKGQCGLTVSELRLDVLPGAILVKQLTEEGEHKDFVYPFTQLKGRVEVSYDG